MALYLFNNGTQHFRDEPYFEYFFPSEVQVVAMFDPTEERVSLVDVFSYPPPPLIRPPTPPFFTFIPPPPLQRLAPCRRLLLPRPSRRPHPHPRPRPRHLHLRHRRRRRC